MLGDVLYYMNYMTYNCHLENSFPSDNKFQLDSLQQERKIR